MKIVLPLLPPGAQPALVNAQLLSSHSRACPRRKKPGMEFARWSLLVGHRAASKESSEGYRGSKEGLDLDKNCHIIYGGTFTSRPISPSAYFH